MLTILNDTHLGAERVAGTTMESRQALKAYQHTKFKELLPEDGDLMILGDLFDTYRVDHQDLRKTLFALLDWVAQGSGHLWLVAGNHDLSKTSNVEGSFDMLCKLMQRLVGQRVTVVMQPMRILGYGYCIPHLANQELFDAALKQVPQCKYLFLHCNFDNKFAAQSDQSLNLSAEQALSAPVESIIVAHEHNSRQVGKVHIPGNQIASSVSDWVHSDEKAYACIDTDSEADLTFAPVVERSVEFINQDWKSTEVTDHKFVRVVGEATAEQAAEVVAAIDALRKKSKAFVVANAVQIESESGAEAFSTSLESVRAFDVWNALGECLSPDEYQILRGLS